MAPDTLPSTETLDDLLEAYGGPETLRDMASSIADLLACGRNRCAAKTIPVTASAIWLLLELAKKGGRS